MKATKKAEYGNWIKICNFTHYHFRSYWRMPFGWTLFCATKLHCIKNKTIANFVKNINQIRTDCIVGISDTFMASK